MRFPRPNRMRVSVLAALLAAAFAVVSACSEESSTATCPSMPPENYLEAGAYLDASYQLEDYTHIYNPETGMWVQGVTPSADERRWVEILLELKALEDAGCITYPYPPAFDAAAQTPSAGGAAS